MKSSAPAKIEELESVRGLAALLVVIYHIPQWNEALNFQLIRNGYLMVELFFVLSGFVIHQAYAERLMSARDLARFQFLRFARLYPVHLVFLAVFVAIEGAKWFAQTRYGIISPNTQPFRENGPTAILQHVLLVQAIGPTGNGTTLNGPAWSISVEFYTYLVFGLIVLATAQWKHVAFAAIAAVALAMLVAERTLGFELLLRCFAGFFLGCLVAKLAGAAQVRLPSLAPAAVFVAIIAFLSWKTDAAYDPLIFALSALFILALRWSATGWAATALRARPLVWLGTISYSLYMSHTATLWVANQVFRVVLKRPEIQVVDRLVPQLAFGETVIAWTVILAVVLVGAQLTYLLIERPFRERSRRSRLWRERTAA